ncbi:M56 family metallopeptidase [Dokdonia ponticola]|uniref:M56 family metallopeptidase n=1 Tax=Dokdonia ponticola TaxID=2041041 RepID=A0ABV9I3E9_9FLAO
MIHYILQIIAYQLLFLVVYDIFLKKETFFTWNRCYLLITPILSFILPFIKIDAIRETIPTSYTIALPEVLLQTSIADAALNGGMLDEIVLTGTKPINFITWMLGIWIVGMVITFAYFVYKVIKIQHLKSRGTLKQIGDLQIVTLPNTDTAFSFFNTIFLGENLSDAQRDNIMLHETIHIKERHSFDMLFFEVLRIICWFNPLIYVYQSKMMLLQEYTADAKVVSQRGKKTYYQSLLSQVFRTESISFINPFFNHSLIKKRIIMLQKVKSRKIAQFKYAFILPVIFGILCYVSCTDDTTIVSQDNTEIVPLTELVIEVPEGVITEEEYTKLVDQVKNYYLQKGDNLSSEDLDEYAEFIKNLKKKVGVKDIQKQKFDIRPGEKEIEYEMGQDIPFAVIEKAPTFAECTGTNEERKKCMSAKVSKHVANEFDVSLGKKLGLTGINRVFVAFKIDKQGNIVNIRARAPHPDLEVEAKRVMKTLPQMQPGEQNGQPVGVLYSLPITFKIQS